MWELHRSSWHRQEYQLRSPPCHRRDGSLKQFGHGSWWMYFVQEKHFALPFQSMLNCDKWCPSQENYLPLHLARTDCSKSRPWTKPTAMTQWKLRLVTTLSNWQYMVCPFIRATPRQGLLERTEFFKWEGSLTIPILDGWTVPRAYLWSMDVAFTRPWLVPYFSHRMNKDKWNIIDLYGSTGD